MDNWDATVVYRVAVDRHRERVARGQEAQQVAETLGVRPLRVRVAAALTAGAARLDPAVIGPRRTTPNPAVA